MARDVAPSTRRDVLCPKHKEEDEELLGDSEGGDDSNIAGTGTGMGRIAVLLSKLAGLESLRLVSVRCNSNIASDDEAMVALSSHPWSGFIPFMSGQRHHQARAVPFW